jgi:signal transduction histidine kinase
MSIRLSLSQRFALVIFSVGSLLVVPLVGLETHIARQALHQRMQDSSLVIVDALESLVRAHMDNKDVPVLRMELQELVTHNRLAYVDLYDPSGRLLVRAVSPNHPRGTTYDSDIKDVQDNVLDLRQSVGAPSRMLGRIEVGLWVGGLREDVREIARNGIAMGITLCFALALISWVLGRWLASRLERYAGDLAHRAPEDFHYLEARGNDEISALGHAFNRLQDRLKEAVRRREEAERERLEMTQMIIHDLKGPLGGFAVGLDLLKESVQKAGDLSQLQTLELMERATGRLLRMTNSILQFGRLQDPSHQLRFGQIDLKMLLIKRVEEARLSAQDRGVQIQFSVPRESEGLVRGDGDLLDRVLDNLIFNAVEHTPHGGTIQVLLKTEPNAFCVEVRDSGPGIPPEERETIFEKFRKGRHASRGVGLGLAFCKLAVERHGGQIGVTNTPEGGALFYFTLPVETPVHALLA